MRWGRVASVAAGVVLLMPACSAPVPELRLDERIPARAEETYQVLDAEFDAARSLETVAFMDQFWRLDGNPGYVASLEHIREGLRQAGFDDRASVEAAGSRARVWVEEAPQERPAWDHSVARITLLPGGPVPSEEVLLSRETHWVTLCINSFSTPLGGVVAPIVDVGQGIDPADYDRKNVRGAIVFGDGQVRRLWQEAVVNRGAVGVISGEMADYVKPPANSPPDSPAWDVLQWGSIPYDSARQSFAFKASLRAASRLRQLLAAGAVKARVEITSQFYQEPSRSLIAEIAGQTSPDERVVLFAHVQEPGANDNASGCATLLGLARVIQSALATERIQPPGRTLTLIWGDEIRGSRRWLAEHPDQRAKVRYMMSLDMTGENTDTTGGTFLIEKEPDPSAVWDRPSDPHTAWGRGQVQPGDLKGSLLNDLHLAVCLRRARDTGWVVRTNPYEGGSDHTVFNDAGVPALLNWHFPDRYYHTNLDRVRETSAAELEQVGVSVATTALFLASADDADAQAVIDLISACAEERLELEGRQGAELLRTNASTPETEAAVLQAWKRWYDQALQSVLTLPVTPASATLRDRVDAALRELHAIEAPLR